MRIAQISSLWEPVPPRTYGGTELVVHLLTEGLVQRGHEVVLFATADSTTEAQLKPACAHGFRELGWDREPHREKNFANVFATELRMLGQIFAQADRFDVIHNHLGGTALPFSSLVDTPVVTTLHNPLEPDQVRELYNDYSHLPYISISDYQRTLWPELNYAATIYHGIDVDLFTPRFEVDSSRGYLAFLGRMCPHKGAHLAIEIAHAVGRPLILAGKIDEADREYFETSLQPQIDDERIRYIGEVNHEQKVDLLRNAIATLFPIQWAEPFGLVLIESMACGTPVLAIHNGSIPEIVQSGASGFIGESTADLIVAFDKINEIDRHDCRREVERRFSAARMVSDHEQLYQSLVAGQPTAGGPPGGTRTPSHHPPRIEVPLENQSGMPPISPPA